MGPISEIPSTLLTTPGELDEVAACVEACFECAATCISCAASCLAEKEQETLTRCIRLNLDCADICEATGRVLARRTDTDPDIVRAQLQACAEACRRCAEECETHARDGMDDCRASAEACRRCERACDDLLASGPVR